MGTPIPQPPGVPLLGNIMDIDRENALVSILHLADIYGSFRPVAWEEDELTDVD